MRTHHVRLIGGRRNAEVSSSYILDRLYLPNSKESRCIKDTPVPNVFGDSVLRLSLLLKAPGIEALQRSFHCSGLDLNPDRPISILHPFLKIIVGGKRVEKIFLNVLLQCPSKPLFFSMVKMFLMLLFCHSAEIQFV